MATLRESIYDIKEIFDVDTDDKQLSDEHLADLIKTKRAKYLRNYLSNLKKEIPLEAKQLICMELCDDDLCDDDYKVLRTTNKIPANIESTGRSNIAEAYLGSRFAKYINIIDYSRIPYIMSGRYIDMQIYISVDPLGYGIVLSKSGNHEILEELRLNITAEDPEFADQYTCDCEDEENSCDFYDKKFPIELSMLDDIKKEIINELSIKFKIPSDSINNSQDDSINKIAPNERGAR